MSIKKTKLGDRYLNLLKESLTASLYSESAWQITQELPEENKCVVEKRIFKPNRRAAGLDWPLFGFTMVGHRRLENIRMCVEDVLENNVEGDLMEAGVWRGGASIYMKAILDVYDASNRSVWLADSFEGMPVPKDGSDGADLSQNEYLSVSLEQVKDYFAQFNHLDENVKFLKGWFCDTLPSAPVKTLAVLRLDGDLYSSTMDSLNNLYHRVSKGGYVIIDDYGGWPPAKNAVDEFRQRHDITAEIKKVDWTGVYWQVET